MAGRTLGSAARSERAGRVPSLLATALPLLAGLLLSPERASAVNPLRPDEASLLGGVDSARACVVTVIGIPRGDLPGPTPGVRKRLIATGVVSGRHRVVTTASVALHGGPLRVLLAEGDERVARLRGIDRQSNISLLEVSGAPLQALRRAPPQSLAVGSWVAVVANAGATRPQVTLGRILGRGERVDFPYAGEIVEIDARAAPGSGGGAILNEDGAWVAVVVGRASEGRSEGSAVRERRALGSDLDPDGVLVALPVDQLDRITDDLEEYGSVRRGFLGVRLRVESQADSLGIEIRDVIPDSPAARAGIQAGDRVLAFEGEVPRSAASLTEAVRGLRPGDEVALTLSRASEIFPVRVVLGTVLIDEYPGARTNRKAELLRLKTELRRLDAERSRVEEQIRVIQGGPSGR